MTPIQIAPPSLTPLPRRPSRSCHVSTDEQNLDRQRELTYKYATERLGVPHSAIGVYTDKGTGTNTDRRGYRDLILLIPISSTSEAA